MGRPNPQFRRPFRASPLRRKRAQPSFALQVVAACAVVSAVTWSAAPQLNAAWTIARSTPEEVEARERSAYYRNCDAARAAGAAPIYQGEPGYRPEMDGDGDGIACEPYRGLR